ncbi:zf-HC2 domain-containing protein [Microbacterium sp.]|uniref:zf-HC2 domain-containing protein n=1 Tax=Microbacterium sp. TaxID=51671 RepID=UPI0028128265|nr:zf-HC2 domain-containing protein [Microbacterium sp.]
MTADHERFAEWDAAYILGTLTPADRDLYQAHLADCALCVAAVAELAPLPGLLSRVSRERATSLLAGSDDVEDAGRAEIAGEPDAARRAEIIGIGEARARRARRTRWVGAAVGAAALIAGVVLVPSWLAPDEAPAIVLEAVADVPLSASVRLDDVAWGTRVTMTCSYERAADAPDGGWEYELVVIADDGTETPLSTWRALPERTAEITAGTALHSADIAAVEVRSAKTGAVLMSTAPQAPGDDSP